MHVISVLFDRVEQNISLDEVCRNINEKTMVSARSLHTRGCNRESLACTCGSCTFCLFTKLFTARLAASDVRLEQ
ncbi:MAG: hypothetical protein KVP17_001964 [Porospora cf. gigantea B]|uniref:uncharacterized protein n=1 Tax=Porospora cf. gigantea B TaxID=2853592 RepID=UPI003571E617|nr:MAG: hypothetical protein KVP17_001964 [Porospora cf. gigantea B]